MRLDKYLQVTGLIKRRALANEACKLGLITVNNLTAKPTKEISENDIVNIKLAKKEIEIKVLKVITSNSLKKTLRSEYFTVLKEVERKGESEDFWNDESLDDE